MKLAIAQIAMHPSIDANLAHMLRALEVAAAHGADVCAYSELAVTGFHRGIVQLAQPERIAPALAAMRAACRQLGIAAALGAPTWDESGALRNSHVFLDAAGEHLATVHKPGLTPAEATFFPGFDRRPPRPVFALAGQRCSAVICREVQDLAEVQADFSAAHPHVLLWPGMMGPDGTDPVAAGEPARHIQQARAMAQALGAWLVQSNWPQSLNYPDQTPHLGGSVVISPAGEVVLSLPLGASGVGVFALGLPDWHWLPLPAPTT